MKPFQSILATALCAAAIGAPVASLAGVFGNDLSAEEQDLYIREQSIQEEIKEAGKEDLKLREELNAFVSSVETMKTEALSDFRKELRHPDLSDTDKAAIRSAYEKRCEEIEAKLAAKKEQIKKARAAIDEQLGTETVWFATGLYGEQQKVSKALQETVEKEASGALSRLLDNGMVEIPGKDYRMGRFEVDQALWQAVMGENPSQFKGAHRPVECVSWNEIQEFLRKLNAMSDVVERDVEFRLPTKQEWEYACRAGATGDYNKLADGTEITKDTLGQVAWFKDDSNEKTHPVGQKKPNAFGLYDMHGNVSEWTSSGNDEHRVHCGGDWSGSVWDCEASHQSPFGGTHSDTHFNCIGFRLCADNEAK